MLTKASGSFEDNPVLYINCQLHYHLSFSKDDIEKLSDEEWAEYFAILTNIRKEEAKQKPFG